MSIVFRFDGDELHDRLQEVSVRLKLINARLGLIVVSKLFTK